MLILFIVPLHGQVGLPMFVVQAKMTAAGFDPALLDTPDAPI